MRSSVRGATQVVLAAALLAGAAESAEWSHHAIVVPENRTFQVPSPDRKRYLVVEDALLTMREAGQVIPGSEGIDVLRNAELLWSPDSKAFALTSLDRDDGGTWDVSVFVIENDRVNYHSVTRDAVSRFRERFPCMAAEDPHIGVIRWMKESKQLLLCLEIPPGRMCREAGARLGALVNIPSGSVARMYEQGDLAMEWGESLGKRFTPKRK